MEYLLDPVSNVSLLSEDPEALCLQWSDIVRLEHCLKELSSLLAALTNLEECSERLFERMKVVSKRFEDNVCEYSLKSHKRTQRLCKRQYIEYARLWRNISDIMAQSLKPAHRRLRGHCE